MKTEYILITASGPDRPGITSSLTEIIAASSYPIVDMGQSVTHKFLSLSILLDCKGKNDSGPILKELLFAARNLGLGLDFQVLENGRPPSLGDKYLLTCVSTQTIPPAFIRDIAGLLASESHNILRIDNLIENEFTGLEILTQAGPGAKLTKLKADLLHLGQEYSIDMAYLKDNIYRRNKRIIVFDMDSTLIQTEVIDELAKVHGVGKQVIAITERAMNGELDFDESLRERVKLLKGLNVEVMEDILNRLPLTPGAEEFLKRVKSLGLKVAIISGGFLYFADALKERLNLDYAFANNLEVENGIITGNLVGTIINGEYKAILLDLICQQEKVSLEQVVAVGDGANDLPMLTKAGLGIAFHAKEVVRKKASHHLSFGPMTSLLYFLGLQP